MYIVRVYHRIFIISCNFYTTLSTGSLLFGSAAEEAEGRIQSSVSQSWPEGTRSSWQDAGL